MSDLYPAHGDEACTRCSDPIQTWYCLIELGPHIFEVTCPACYLLATGEAA